VNWRFELKTFINNRFLNIDYTMDISCRNKLKNLFREDIIKTSKLINKDLIKSKLSN